MVEPVELTIRAAAESLHEGKLTSLTLTEAVLARLEATEPLVNAYITVTADLAREQARAADAELAAGRDRGPLHGIPLGLKDLIDVQGVPTTAGSGFYREVAREDAFVVRRLREAGAVIVGKQNLHEFALGATNVNPHFGPVRNPWDRARVSGGSSGGSGASVAVGSCLAALGTDTGGSVRIPAALCGVTGLLPTTGRVSRWGVFPLSTTLDHVGPLARSVEDCALVLQAIAGHDPRDPLSVDVSVPDFTSELGRDLRGLRVGVPRDALWQDCQEPVREACERALAVLASLGAELREVSLPQAAAAGRVMVSAAEAAAHHAPWLDAHPERYGPDVRERLALGAAMRAPEYIAQLALLRALRDEVRGVLGTVDLLVSPTTPLTAPRIEEGNPDNTLSRYTRLYNYLALPAISVPCGFDAGGLPIGLMLAGRPFEEPVVLRAAHAFEQATDWRRRPPSGR